MTENEQLIILANEDPILNIIHYVRDANGNS